MGAARLHNDLDGAVAASSGTIRFATRGDIFTKSSEAGDPGDIAFAIIGFGAAVGIVRATLPALKDALLGWLRYRSDREIELHAGEFKVHIKGDNDVEKAMNAIEKLAAERD